MLVNNLAVVFLAICSKKVSMMNSILKKYCFNEHICCYSVYLRSFEILFHLELYNDLHEYVIQYSKIN